MTIVVASARASALATAGTSNNPILTGANTVTATETTSIGTELNAAENAFSGYTYDFWTATPNGSNIAALQFTTSSGITPTFCAIASHNIATLGGSVRLQYSTNSGSTWTDSGAGPVTPTDNQPIGFRFSGVTADYWRVYVTGISADVSIAVVWIGSEIIVPQRLYSGFQPALTANQVELNSNVSEGNHYIGSAFTVRGSGWQMPIQHVDPTFIRGATWLAFQDGWNKGQPAFMAWRPTKYGDLHYSWRAGAAIAPVNMGIKDLMEFTIEGRANHDW